MDAKMLQARDIKVMDQKLETLAAKWRVAMNEVSEIAKAEDKTVSFLKQV